ncbi:uncharacterized protein K02A2.6-like [Melospiza melodia melodia]|uniref:uncharacterized protein K02A2.6-like n=1 Tax=Melospiza melodia melodia TaxID=1914991 RepID=UPI002FD053A9
MGSQQSKDINMKTPLGCILRHWKDLGGIPGGNISKKTLLKYCTQWWPLYRLDDGEKWPPEGTTNYNTILQLILLLRRLNKWDEIMYADMFFTLRNKPEWQKECEINVAPQDPLVLALERDKKGPKPKERCCDACSGNEKKKGVEPTCFYCHKKGHLQRNCKKKQQDEKTSQESQKGQGFCLTKKIELHLEEPLIIKLKVGPQSEEFVFLVNTGVSRSTVTKLPQGCEVSCEQVSVVGITGEAFPVPIIKGVKIETNNKFGVNDLLLVPEAEENMLGRDLIVALNLQIKPCEGKLEIYSLPKEDDLEIDDMGWLSGEVEKFRVKESNPFSPSWSAQACGF